MKTEILITIETADRMDVFEEEGQSADDYVGKEKELEEFQKEFSKNVHNELVEKIMNKEMLEDEFIENLEENSVEGYESFEDYKIDVTIDNKTNPELNKVKEQGEE